MPARRLKGKPRSRAHEKVANAASEQKRLSDVVDGTTVLRAARRAGGRAISRGQKATLERTTASAEKTLRQNLQDWNDPDVSAATLRDEVEPALAQSMAEHTAALRADRPVEKVAAAAKESSAGVAANVASRKASAAKRKKDGFAKTYTLRSGRKLKIVRTGAEVKKRALRDRMLAKLPAHLRPTFLSQTTALPMRSQATGSRRGPAYVRPDGGRSQAEISAQTQARWVTGPDSRGDYQMKIPESLWSNRALGRMRFRPRDKPKRAFNFKGPSAEADAKAFARTMMEWLKKWKKGVGPPPKP